MKKSLNENSKRIDPEVYGMSKYIAEEIFNQSGQPLY